MNFKYSILVGLIFAAFSVLAQDSTSTKTRQFQFSVIPPISTDGMDAKNNINKTSINLLGGYSKGVEGVEISGLFNITDGDMNGVQAAGIANVTMENIDGAQISGVLNVNLGDVDGVQIGGTININNGNFDGAQLAGAGNINRGSFKGIQASGTGNINVGDLYGSQLAGIGNIITGEHDGFQGAGLFNITKGRVKGVQIAGLVNYADTLEGVQIGLINVVDTIEKGLPIGLLSFVRNGYHKFEVEGSRNRLGAISFKTGVPGFYNIISVIGKYRGARNFFGIGYGVGSYIKLGENSGIQLDLIAYQLKDNNFDRFEFTHLDRFKANYAFYLGKKLEVYGGPNLNILIFEPSNNTNGELSQHFNKLGSIYEYEGGTLGVHVYPGFNFGLRF